MATDAEFHLRHEAAEEVKRLAAHPVQELERLEHEALDGSSAASLGIIVLGVFLGVTAIAVLLYALVIVAARLAV